MSVMKVLEILSSSEKGWDDATQKAVAEASKTIKNIKSVYIHDQSATVNGGKIKEYRVNARITFEIDRDNHKERESGKSKKIVSR